MYVKKIEEYIVKVCNHIKWKNYASGIEKEIRAHISDEISRLTIEGKEKEEAVELALNTMGNPDDLGKQLNAVYQPEYKRSALSFLAILLVLATVECCFMYNGLGEYLQVFLRIFIGVLGALMLFNLDWSDSSKINKFAVLSYNTIVLLSSVIVITNVSADVRIIESLLVLTVPTGCCILERLKGKRILGLFCTILLFLLPAYISYRLQAFSGMIIIIFSAWLILVFTIKSNWLQLKGRVYYYGLVTIPLAITVLYTYLHKIENIRMNWDSFFVREFLKINEYCLNRELLNATELTDYPLTFMVACFGYKALVLYLLILLLLFVEIIKIYKRQHNFVAKILILSVLGSLVFETLFSIALNMGIPLAKSITVPFLDFNFGIIVKIFQLGLVKKIDCFGNYIFSNYNENKLFDIEDGKIIIYYR